MALWKGKVFDHACRKRMTGWAAVCRSSSDPEHLGNTANSTQHLFSATHLVWLLLQLTARVTSVRQLLLGKSFSNRGDPGTINYPPVNFSFRERQENSQQGQSSIFPRPRMFLGHGRCGTHSYLRDAQS